MIFLLAVDVYQSRIITFDAVHSWVEIGNLTETSCAIRCSQSLKINSKYDFFFSIINQSLSPTDFFRGQLEILNNAVVDNCIILGDFNLDAGMEERQDYGYKYPLELLSNFVFENNLFQVVNFNTWSRVIYGIKKESCLDTFM